MMWIANIVESSWRLVRIFSDMDRTKRLISHKKCSWDTNYVQVTIDDSKDSWTETQTLSQMSRSGIEVDSIIATYHHPPTTINYIDYSKNSLTETETETQLLSLWHLSQSNEFLSPLPSSCFVSCFLHMCTHNPFILRLLKSQFVQNVVSSSVAIWADDYYSVFVIQFSIVAITMDQCYINDINCLNLHSIEAPITYFNRYHHRLMLHWQYLNIVKLHFLPKSPWKPSVSVRGNT